MTSFLRANGIRIFDYPKFASPLRDKFWDNAAKVAEAADARVERITKNYICKEDIVAKAIAERSEHPPM